MHDAVNIRFVTEQTSGVGTIFDVATRIGPFRTTDRMTITEWVEEKIIGVEHTGIVTGTGEFTFEPIADRTTFRWMEQLQLPWWLGGRIGELVAKPLLSEIWKRNLRGLKRRIERGTRLAPVEDGFTPGELIGQGRDGDVREWGPNMVIRTSRSGADVRPQHELMAYLLGQGFPVPGVHPHPDKTVTVMDRIQGPTMLADLVNKPWLLRRHAVWLARLHDQLRTIPPPEGLRDIGGGDSLLHLDLHPNNVLITEQGPVVIDWSNAAVGPGDLDVALTWIIIKTGPITGNLAARTIGVGLREQFCRVYAKAAGEARIRAHATAAAELRLLDPNLLASERDEVFRLARSLQNRPTRSRTDEA